MESVLKNIYINKIHVPKFHGHVRLELRGCRETEVIEHDNHMTDALQQLLDANGVWMNPGKVLEKLCPTVSVAFGGILLVDTVLPDDAISLPGGTEVTGCAAYGIANSDEALTQGSYNTNESVLDMPSKKMTYVYDWTTNQANGTIASVALTHVNTGICGYGDPNLGIGSGKYDFDISGANNTFWNIENIRPCFENSDYMISVILSNKQLTVYKYSSEEKNIFPISISRTTTKKLENVVYEQKEFTVTENINVDCNCNDGRYVYFATGYTISKNGILSIVRLDTVDMTITSFAITNNTTKTWYPTYGIDVYDNKLYIPGPKVFYEIDLLNVADVKEYETDDQIYLNKLVNLQKGKLFMRSNRCVKIFDCVTKSLKNTKMSSTDTNNVINSSIKPARYYTGSSASGAIDRRCILLYLATISNLDKPVQKTADKTLKVTYTIQQE